MKHLLLFLIILFASCTKEVSKPIELRLPQRSINTVDVTIKFFVTSHPLAPGNLYGLQIRSSKTLNQQTTFHIEWKDGSRIWQLQPFIHAGQSVMDWHTMIPILNGASDLRLIKVDGDSTIVYRLKQGL